MGTFFFMGNKMFKLQTKLLLGAIILATLLGSVWVVQDWRYLGKIADNEVTHLNNVIKAREARQEEIDFQQRKADTAASDYAKQIEELRATVSNSNSAINSLRKQTSDLRTELAGVSEQTVRAYAQQASESLLAISERYTDTARQADEYYLAWQALDRAWPKAEPMKEVNEQQDHN